jgi:hypothetical protein
MESEDIIMDIDTTSIQDFNTIKKMTFIYNALQDGWTVVKKEDKYIFIKKHEGKKEILSEEYLKKFIARNFSST